mgnify:CR=1 FL=1
MRGFKLPPFEIYLLRKMFRNSGRKYFTHILCAKMYTWPILLQSTKELEWIHQVILHKWVLSYIDCSTELKQDKLQIILSLMLVDLNLLTYFRRATRLVLGAAVVFLVLMMPKAISYLIRVFGDPEGNVGTINDTHTIIDNVAYWLQYLNHSVNFFVYVLVYKKFRISQVKCKW